RLPPSAPASVSPPAGRSSDPRRWRRSGRSRPFLPAGLAREGSHAPVRGDPEPARDGSPPSEAVADAGEEVEGKAGAQEWLWLLVRPADVGRDDPERRVVGVQQVLPAQVDRESGEVALDLRAEDEVRIELPEQLLVVLVADVVLRTDVAALQLHPPAFRGVRDRRARRQPRHPG